MDSAWLVVGDTIYDATFYISRHPGGSESILKKSGGRVDCTVDFDFHSKKAQALWKNHKVGKLRPCVPKDAQQPIGIDSQCTIS
jgi:cytochrome b involved in lipid metabolism